MGLMRSLLLKGSRNAWLANQIRRRRFAQRAVRRFMPGETADAALAASEEFRQYSISTVLTLLGEDITERAEAEGVRDHYLDVQSRIARAGLPTHVSVKPTQLGIGIGNDLCREQLAALAKDADAKGSFLWIDIESSSWVDATLDLYRTLRGEHANVGLCLQSYLYRTADDLESLLRLDPTIRLVKGAYKEAPEVAYPRKRDVDENFMRLAKRLLSPDGRRAGQRHGFGTHDLQLLARIGDYADGAGLPKDAYEIQMLYGIKRDAQILLAAQGHSVRVLISYGSHWFPWYMRRLAERPANLWFVAKSVVG